MKPSPLPLLVVALALVTGVQAGHAATFCVNTAAELRNALSVAGGNGEDDLIRIRTGTYSDDTYASSFVYSTPENYALTLQGGWTAFLTFDCFKQENDPSTTVLSGSDQRSVLRMIPTAGTTGAISIENLTVRDGNANERGAGLRFSGTDFLGALRIERTYFVANVVTGFGGGVSISTNGTLELRNNWFRSNRCGNNFCAGEIFVNHGNAATVRNFIGNNTVVANSCSSGADPLCDTGGFGVYGSARAAVFNTVFAFNGGNDVKLLTDSTELLYNNINQFAGTPMFNIGNLNLEDPQFVNPFGPDFHLQPESPLRDAGTTAFDLGAVDFDGLPRINGAGVDIGAFENDEVIFDDGFEILQ